MPRKYKYNSPLSVFKKDNFIKKIGKSINLLGITLVMFNANIHWGEIWFVIGSLLQWLGPTITDLFTINNGSNNREENNDSSSESKE